MDPNMNKDQSLEWRVLSFYQLSTIELFELLRVRQEVFIVEQNCPYLDIDLKDLAAFHLIGSNGDEIAAYLRILPPSVSYLEPSLGRVLTASKYRGTGAGKALLAEALREVEKRFPGSAIRISAQAHLEKFYGASGFEKVSEPYLEDGIPHIEMYRRAVDY